MNRELRVDYKDFKTRKIKSHGMWLMVSREIDLALLENGKVYSFEIGQLLDGRYIAERVLNPEHKSNMEDKDTNG